jgi:hypothetical protein
VKRWVRYELPVMVCLWESDEERVTHVVVCDDKLAPARDDHGPVLVYDGDSPGLEPVSCADQAGVHAFAVTNRLDLLPDRRTWE